MNGIKEYLEKGIAKNEKFEKEVKQNLSIFPKTNTLKTKKEIELREKLKKYQEKIIELNQYLSEVQEWEENFIAIYQEKEKNEETLARFEEKVKDLENNLNLKDFLLEAKIKELSKEIARSGEERKKNDQLRKELVEAVSRLNIERNKFLKYKKTLSQASSPMISPAGSFIIEVNEPSRKKIGNFPSFVNFGDSENLVDNEEFDEDWKDNQQFMEEKDENIKSGLEFLWEETDKLIVDTYVDNLLKFFSDLYPETQDNPEVENAREIVSNYFINFQEAMKIGVVEFYSQQISSLEKKIQESEENFSKLGDEYWKKEQENNELKDSKKELEINVEKLKNRITIEDRLEKLRKERDERLQNSVREKIEETKKLKAERIEIEEDWRQKYDLLLTENLNLKRSLSINWQDEEENHANSLEEFQKRFQVEVFDSQQALQVIKGKLESLPPLSPLSPVFSNIKKVIGEMDGNFDISQGLLEASQTVFVGYAGQDQEEKSEEWKNFLNLMQQGVEITISQYRSSWSSVLLITNREIAKKQKEEIDKKVIDDLMILVGEEFKRIGKEWEEEKEKEFSPLISEKESLESQLKAIEEVHEKLQKSYEELEEEKKGLSKRLKEAHGENVEKEKFIDELQEQIQALSNEKETKTKELVKKIEDLREIEEEKISETKKEGDEKVARLEKQVKNITEKKAELEKEINAQNFLIEGDTGYKRQIEELEKYLEDANRYNIELKEKIDELIQDKVDEEKYSKNGNVHLRESSSSSNVVDTLYTELNGKMYSSPCSSPIKESPTSTNSGRGKSFSFSQRNRSASIMSIASIATISSFDSSYDSLNLSLDNLKEEINRLRREKKVLLSFLEVKSFEGLQEKLSGKRLGEWIEELENSRNKVKELEAELEASRRELKIIGIQQNLTMKPSLSTPEKTPSSSSRNSRRTSLSHFPFGFFGARSPSSSVSGRGNNNSDFSVSPPTSVTPLTSISTVFNSSENEEIRNLRNRVEELEFEIGVLHGRLEKNDETSIFGLHENIPTNLTNNNHEEWVEEIQKRVVQKLIEDLDLSLNKNTRLEVVISVIKELIEKTPPLTTKNEENTTTFAKQDENVSVSEEEKKSEPILLEEIEKLKKELREVKKKLVAAVGLRKSIEENEDEVNERLKKLQREFNNYLALYSKARNEVEKLKQINQKSEDLTEKLESNIEILNK